ncbi:unnamed protein product [Effrenium voratum]|uniref:Uncharacterized protein n=1 Tax=Effrenium voratum TaxID=2562239 RepID=A0AA36NAU5_9DINO|nr:unnamed protein product [Effrenium voratum]
MRCDGRCISCDDQCIESFVSTWPLPWQCMVKVNTAVGPRASLSIAQMPAYQALPEMKTTAFWLRCMHGASLCQFCHSPGLFKQTSLDVGVVESKCTQLHSIGSAKEPAHDRQTR